MNNVDVKEGRRYCSPEFTVVEQETVVEVYFGGIKRSMVGGQIQQGPHYGNSNGHNHRRNGNLGQWGTMGAESLG